MNYRSILVFGNAQVIDDPDEKLAAFDALVEHLAPGRTADLRPSKRKEINATTMLKLPIETFSIKSRSGPPSDASYDIELPVWAGVIPITLNDGEPIDAPDLPADIEVPAYLR